MKNYKEISELKGRDIKGVFFDIDDTFTTDGKITKEAFNALWRLKEAGKIVVPITGRPAGWCDHIARMWPVTAVVGENGAFYFMMRRDRLDKCYIWGQEEANKRGLELIREEVLKKFPKAGVASDQNYREFDLAIDFAEDVARLAKDEIDGIVEIGRRHGAKVKISSIHINIWFGEYDKLSGTKVFAKNELGVDLDRDNGHFVFCGDSPNDEPMFEFFKNSVGVNNVLGFEDRLKNFPKFVTKGRSGAGFVEAADALLAHH